MRTRIALISSLLVLPCLAQQPTAPDLNAQRAAMKKLAFLVGTWTGEARIQRGSGEPLILVQTEDAQFKLDGLLMVIEGIGRSKTDGKPILQAFGLISYDDQAGAYRMKAFNDGRFVETEVKLLESGAGVTWGFTFGQIKTSSVLRMSDAGDWTELTELAIGSQPPRKYMELRVSRNK
jgi:hypothetical protein